MSLHITPGMRSFVLCSKCSAHLTPIVAVDIDGTLGNYHKHFVDFSMDYFQPPTNVNSVYGGEESFKKWWMREFNLGEKEWHDVKLAYRQGGMKRTMPIFPGASSMMARVRSAGPEVWVTTTRPYLSLDNIVPDTVEWLNRNSIEYDGILFDEDKYAQLVERVDRDRIVAILDDLPEMCLSADGVVGRHVAIMASTQYNRDCAWPTTLDLRGAEYEILTRIREWYRIHV